VVSALSVFPLPFLSLLALSFFLFKQRSIRFSTLAQHRRLPLPLRSGTPTREDSLTEEFDFSCCVYRIITFNSILCHTQTTPLHPSPSPPLPSSPLLSPHSERPRPAPTPQPNPRNRPIIPHCARPRRIPRRHIVPRTTTPANTVAGTVSGSIVAGAEGVLVAAGTEGVLVADGTRDCRARDGVVGACFAGSGTADWGEAGASGGSGVAGGEWDVRIG